MLLRVPSMIKATHSTVSVTDVEKGVLRLWTRVVHRETDRGEREKGRRGKLHLKSRLCDRRAVGLQESREKESDVVSRFETGQGGKEWFVLFFDRSW
ncbi:hypothetical protein EBZ80_14610 [bacterium]|nr:hypothetical protein [bacterium]